MSEEDPDVFQEFRFWLYTGNLSDTFKFSRVPRNDKGEAERDLEGNRKWHALIDLYSFAERRCILSIHDDLINAFMDGNMAENMMTNSFLHKVFKQTSKSSKLRELLVDHVLLYPAPTCVWLDDHRFHSESGNETKEYLVQILRAALPKIQDLRQNRAKETVRTFSNMNREKYYL